MSKKILTILRSKMCLSRLIHYADMIHLSAQVILVDLETLQVIVKSNRQHTSFDETMKSSQPEFYTDTSLLSQVICRKHNIYKYLSEYWTKL